MTRIVPADEARDLLTSIPDTDVEAYTEPMFFTEAGDVKFHGVRYTDKRTVDGIAFPVSGCATRAWADLAATAPNLAHTVIHQDGEIADLFQEVDDHHHDLLRVMEERNQQAAQIKRLQEQVDNTALVNEDGLKARVARVRKALLDEGVHPPYHRRQVERLRQEWPTLYQAIMHLVKP